MKRIICLILFVCTTFALSCCAKRVPNAASAAGEINSSLALGKVYSSVASEGDEQYIDNKMKRSLFGDVSLPFEYAVILGLDTDCVNEIGILYADGTSGVPDCTEIATRRLNFISDFSQEGDRFMLRYGDVVIYAYVQNGELAKEAIGLVFS